MKQLEKPNEVSSQSQASVALPLTHQIPAPKRHQPDYARYNSGQTKSPLDNRVGIFDGYGTVMDAASVFLGVAALVGVIATFIQTWGINSEARLRGEAETRAYLSPLEITARVFDAGLARYAFTFRNPGKSPANLLHIVRDGSSLTKAVTFPVMAESTLTISLECPGDFTDFSVGKDGKLRHEFRFYVFYADVFGYIHAFNVGGHINKDAGDVIDPIEGLLKSGVPDGAQPLQEKEWEQYLPKALHEYDRFRHRKPPGRKRTWLASMFQRA